MVGESRIKSERAFALPWFMVSEVLLNMDMLRETALPRTGQTTTIQPNFTLNAYLLIGCRITWDDLKLRVTTMWNSEHYILHKRIHTHSNLKFCACFKPPLIAPDSHYCLNDLKHILFITFLTFNFSSLIKQSARNVTPEMEDTVESIALWDSFPSSYAGSVACTSSQR